jgi:hypothetical protein
MSQFFGGELAPTWPHAVLIAGTIIGGGLVGLGVILEAPKIISLPVAAVFLGVVIESACTLMLFGFDEGISSKQQDRLFETSKALLLTDQQLLETVKKLSATQHELSDRAPHILWSQQDILDETAKFPGIEAYVWAYPASSPDSLLLAMNIGGLMNASHWKVTVWDTHTAFLLPGITIVYRKGTPNAKEAAEALARGLRKAEIEPVDDPTGMEKDDPAMALPGATVAWQSQKDPINENIRVFVGGKLNKFR